MTEQDTVYTHISAIIIIVIIGITATVTCQLSKILFVGTSYKSNQTTCTGFYLFLTRDKTKQILTFGAWVAKLTCQFFIAHQISQFDHHLYIYSCVSMCIFSAKTALVFTSLL